MSQETKKESTLGEYAVVQWGGKQITVKPGQRVKVFNIEGEKGSATTLDKVMILNKGSGAVAQVGTPFISGASVQAKILGHSRAKKVLLLKKRNRGGYVKKQGHRQDMTELLIESING